LRVSPSPASAATVEADSDEKADEKAVVVEALVDETGVSRSITSTLSWKRVMQIMYNGKVNVWAVKMRSRNRAVKMFNHGLFVCYWRHNSV
jgi:hypothetical protein